MSFKEDGFYLVIVVICLSVCTISVCNPAVAKTKSSGPDYTQCAAPEMQDLLWIDCEQKCLSDYHGWVTQAALLHTEYTFTTTWNWEEVEDMMFWMPGRLREHLSGQGRIYGEHQESIDWFIEILERHPPSLADYYSKPSSLQFLVVNVVWLGENVTAFLHPPGSPKAFYPMVFMSISPDERYYLRFVGR